MKKLLISLMFLSSFSAFSETFNFTYTGFEGRTRVFLSCSYAESSALSILETIGATDVTTRCSGGITPVGSAFPVNLTVEFTFPASGTTSEVKSRSFSSNCFFDTKFVTRFASEFKDRVLLLKSRSHCFNSDSSYLFEVQTI